MLIAPLGQVSTHLWTKHPLQAGVTYAPSTGHSSHAMSITSTELGLFLSPPIASAILSSITALSLYTQQRAIGFGPGDISFGMSL